MANLRLAPPLPVFPTEVHGTPIVGLIVTWAGDIAGRRGAPPAAARPRDAARRRDHAEALRRAPEDARPGGAARSALLLEVAPPRPADRRHHRHHLPSTWRTISSPLSSVPIFSFGGAMARVPDDATAFPHRDAVARHQHRRLVAAGAGRRRRPAPGLGARVLRRPRPAQSRCLRELHDRRRAVTRRARPTPTDSASASGGSRRRTTRRTSSAATPTSSRRDALPYWVGASHQNGGWEPPEWYS